MINFIHLEIGLIKCPKNARRTENNCNVAQIYIGCFLKFPPQLNVYCRIYKLFVMRYALRKQDKIKAHFEPNGDEMLNRIKESLTRFFAADRSDFPEGLRDIEDDFNHYPGDPYPTIAVNDVGDPNRMIEFYVTGQQYDVYHLAFKGFIKG